MVATTKGNIMDTDKALKLMRALFDQVEQFHVDLRDADPDQQAAETWDAASGITDALYADIARLESGAFA